MRSRSFSGRCSVRINGLTLCERDSVTRVAAKPRIMNPGGALSFTNDNSIARINNHRDGQQLPGHRRARARGEEGRDGVSWFTNFANNSIGRITMAWIVFSLTGIHE